MAQLLSQPLQPPPHQPEAVLRPHYPAVARGAPVTSSWSLSFEFTTCSLMQEARLSAHLSFGQASSPSMTNVLQFVI